MTMSSTVLHHWLNHFRSSLKDHAVPTTVSPPNGQQAEAPASYVEITRAVLSGREAPVSFARLSAPGTSCEVAIILVTPEIAERYLKNQCRNRILKRRQVEFLARQLARGEWLFNGEPLIFDKDNRMLDGQHRCTSCVKSGVPFLTLVVRGIAADAFDRIDSGTKRTGGDVLRAEGIACPTLTAASVSKLVKLSQTGEWWDAQERPSGHEILSSLAQFPGIEKHFQCAKELARQLGGGGSLWAVARYLTVNIDEPTAATFWEKVVTGIGLEPGDPELRLRQRLLDVRSAAGKVELTTKQYAALITFAWNYRRKGRKIQALRGLHGDEAMPAFI